MKQLSEIASGRSTLRKSGQSHDAGLIIIEVRVNVNPNIYHDCCPLLGTFTCCPQIMMVVGGEAARVHSEPLHHICSLLDDDLEHLKRADVVQLAVRLDQERRPNHHIRHVSRPPQTSKFSLRRRTLSALSFSLFQDVSSRRVSVYMLRYKARRPLAPPRI